MTSDIDNKILDKLNKQEKEEGKLPLLFAFHRELLQAQTRAKVSLGTPKITLDKDSIAARLKQGVPLLTFGDLDYDGRALKKIFIEVIGIFARYPELFGEIPEKLRGPVAGRYLTKKAVRIWFEEARLPAALLAGAAREGLMLAIVHATLKPLLASYAESLIRFVDQERWRRRYCPVCGGSADFAYLDKQEGSRWLLCCRCDTEWLFQRLECPYCGSQDQRALAYFTDDKGLYRLYVCERCKHYLKAIDQRQARDEVLLPLERLVTLDLDSQARVKGYTPYDRASMPDEVNDARAKE